MLTGYVRGDGGEQNVSLLNLLEGKVLQYNRVYKMY